MIPLVSFAGIARAGKDAAADALMPYGYVRRSFGGIIKDQATDLPLSGLLRSLLWSVRNMPVSQWRIGGLIRAWRAIRFGIGPLVPARDRWPAIDPFTQQDTEKVIIRPLLEIWGEANYTAILAEFMGTLPARCVNSRLVRVAEARAWVAKGGVIYEVVRFENGVEKQAATEWEAARLAELRASGLITGTIINDGTIEDLHTKVRNLAFVIPYGLAG